MSKFVYPQISCCEVGKRITMRWLDVNSRGDEVWRWGCSDRDTKDTFDPKAYEADWVLSEVRNIMGGTDRVIRIRFCPGCGTQTPKLRRRAKSLYHKSNNNEFGTCKTCKTRYCDGQDAARVFEIDDGCGVEIDAEPKGLVLAWWNVTNELSAHRTVLGTGDIAVSVSADDNSDFGVEIGTQWSARAHKLPGANAKQRGVIVAAFGSEARGMYAETLEGAMDEVDAILSKSDRLTLRKG